MQPCNIFNESLAPSGRYASVSAHHGSSQTQNVEDAPAHPQGVASLAGAAAKQVHPMRQHRRVAYGLPFLRLLQRPPGVERRRVIVAALKRLKRKTAATL